MLRRILPFLFAAASMGQPTASPVPPEVQKANIDGSTSWPMLNSLDFAAYQNAFAVGLAVQEDLMQNTPICPATFAAAASGQLVQLAWTLPTPSAPRTAILLERNPAWVTTPTMAGTATGYIDQPGAGTWQYRASAVQVIGTKVYPSVWSPWVVVTVSGGPPPPPTQGWTDLSPAPNAVVVYVSSSTGNDSSAGTQASPLKTLGAGYAKVRDGSPDQLLLKAGDTFASTFGNWNKASGSTSQWMVIGTYGTGAPPKIRGPQGDSGITLVSSTLKTGLIVVGIDFEPASRGGSNYSGALVMNRWKHVRFEGCQFVGFPGCANVQSTSDNDPTMRPNDISFFRCVLSESWDTGSGHSQDLFCNYTDGIRIEECVFDLAARNKNTIFDHSCYVHETCGTTIFNWNISARASSHGVQVRPGGDVIGNVFLGNSINAYVGESSGVRNRFNYNVAIDAKNINNTDVRGSAFELESNSQGAEYLYNVAAYQKTGTGNVYGMQFAGMNGPCVARGNVVYKWQDPSGACYPMSYGWFGGTGTMLFENNTGVQPTAGNCIVMGNPALGSWFTARNNRYYCPPRPSGCGFSEFSAANGSGGDFTFWKARAGESGSTFAPMADPGATIENYMISVGRTGGLAEFMAAAKANNKTNWTDTFTARKFGDWVRQKFVVAQAPANP